MMKDELKQSVIGGQRRADESTASVSALDKTLQYAIELTRAQEFDKDRYPNIHKMLEKATDELALLQFVEQSYTARCVNIQEFIHENKRVTGRGGENVDILLIEYTRNLENRLQAVETAARAVADGPFVMTGHGGVYVGRKEFDALAAALNESEKS